MSIVPKSSIVEPFGKGEDDCASIDVWLPERSTLTQINPNATVILYIPPPGSVLERFAVERNQTHLPLNLSVT